MDDLEKRIFPKRKKASKRKSNREHLQADQKAKKPKTGDPKVDLFASYQPWVIQTYGDLAKTKTITLSKYARILKVLKDDEPGTSDSAKFRFWVKAKGFHLGKPPGYDAKPADGIVCRFSALDIGDSTGKRDSSDDPAVYIPNPPVKNGTCSDQVYRKVAIVENFFDIIYTVHAELEGKPGKHAGQKKTYRTITETYAFLPREAVTTFLMGCTECQRRPKSMSPVPLLPTPSPSPTLVHALFASRMAPGEIVNNWDQDLEKEKPGAQKSSEKNGRKFNPLDVVNLTTKNPSKNNLWSPGASSVWVASENEKPNYLFGQEIDFRVPITTTYLKHMKMLEFGRTLQRSDSKDSLSSDPTDIAEEDYSSDAGVFKDAERLKMMLLAWNYQNQLRNGEVPEAASLGAGESMAELWASYHSALGLAAGSKPPGKATPHRDHASPILGTSAVEAATAQDETSSSAGGNGKDEDEGTVAGSDDDSDDRVDPHTHDPERLKAFNMFVRLFVDENLDRIVPISKQPKEKIQAIIDSCTRQFPEFAERARKRIRTYLKSCRRNKRVRGETSGAAGGGSGGTSASWDSTTRPTPAHLTSAAAEHILAQACENESLNAKRMRLGLEPVSQAAPVLNTDSSATTVQNNLLSLYTTPALTTVNSSSVIRDRSPNRIGSTDSTRIAASPPAPLFTNNNNILKDNANTNNNSKTVSPVSSPAPLFKSSFPQTFNQTSSFNRNSSGAAANPALASTALLSTLTSMPPAGVGMNAAAVAAYQTALLSAMASQALPLATPTDLSTKAAANPLTTTAHKLSAAEAAAVRQLVTGYRESAAFLLRSADELDALLH